MASAPGRVNLIGEHTDYNGGFVLPVAIEDRTTVTAALNNTHQITVYSVAEQQTAVVDLSQPILPQSRGSWSNYVRGIVAGFADLGADLKGFDAIIESRIPMGAGLSSSAALLTSMATMLEALFGVKLDPVRKAKLCQQAEHAYAGVPVGIMDPFVCTMGRENHALLLDCRSLEVQWIPFDDPTITLLMINTQVKHELAHSAYAERRQQCEAAARALGVSSLREASLEMLSRAVDLDENARRCARHVIGEIERTLRAATCLRERRWHELGQLLNATHESLKTDFRVSCTELDIVVDIAQALGPERGVFGCRLTGGGFGGCAVAVIEVAHQASIMSAIGDAYRRRTGIVPTLFVSRAGAGANVTALASLDRHA